MTEQTTRKEELRFDGGKVWEKIKSLAKAGNARHLVLKNNGTFFSMTITIAVILAILAPQIMVMLALIVLFVGYSIVVEKDEISVNKEPITHAE